LEATVRVLNDLEAAGVVRRYAIAGAMGANFYIEPTATEDLDVLVLLPAAPSSLDVLRPIYRLLVDERGFAAERECVVVAGIPVQFLEAFDPLTTEGVDEAIEFPVGGTRARVLRIEHLMAIMLLVGRPKDHVRLALAIEQADWDRGRFRAVIGRHGLGAKWAAFRRRFGRG
jgi:hypothetical protein